MYNVQSVVETCHCVAQKRKRPKSQSCAYALLLLHNYHLQYEMTNRVGHDFLLPVSSQCCGYHCTVPDEETQDFTYISFKTVTKLFEPLTAVVLVVWVILELVEFYFTFYTYTLLWNCGEKQKHQRYQHHPNLQRKVVSAY